MLDSYPRLVGVDIGLKRVGLATADPLGIAAQPLGVFSPDGALRELERLRDGEGIETLVIGWPLDADGGEGEAVDRLRPYLKRLRKHLPHVEVVRQDETFSSKRAVRALAASGRRRSSRGRGHIDAAAAAVILQDYLDEVRSERGYGT